MFIIYRNKGSLYNPKRNKLLLVKIAIILKIITIQVCIWFPLPKTGSSPFSAVCLPKNQFLCAVHIFKFQQLLTHPQSKYIPENTIIPASLCNLSIWTEIDSISEGCTIIFLSLSLPQCLFNSRSLLFSVCLSSIYSFSLLNSFM